MREIGQRGDPCTDTERQLAAQAESGCPADATGQWLLLAQRIGLDALVAIFDEFGGEKIHIPQRSNFFEALYRPIRNARVHELRAQGYSASEIASKTGLDRRRVWEALSGRADDGRRRS